MRQGRISWLLLAALVLVQAWASPSHATEKILPETRLRIIGGLAETNQFNQHEVPFWTQRLAELSGGRVTATISASDRSGVRGHEMLRLLGLGVVQFGTLLVSQSTEDPELSAVDLPLVNPDFASLRLTVAAYRPVIRRYLAENYGVELLAVYTYPAQVLYCRAPFKGLGDLSGRRIRASGVAQAELVSAIGAVPVVIPFAEIVAAVRSDVVDCAITGTMTGNGLGLHEVTTHIHELALTWGVSVFAVNGSAWRAMPAPVRDLITREIAVLEKDVWAAAEREAGEGIACNTGSSACASGDRGRMRPVPLSPDDAKRVRALIAGTVLPGWIRRCGSSCAASWNQTLGPLLSIPASGS